MCISCTKSTRISFYAVIDILPTAEAGGFPLSRKGISCFHQGCMRGFHLLTSYTLSAG